MSDQLIDSKRIEKIVRDALLAYNFSAALEDEVLDIICKSLAIGAGVESVADAVAVKKLFLHEIYDNSGVTLSAKINELSRGDEIFQAVRQSIDRANNFNDVVQGLYKKNLQIGDIPKVFERIRQVARQAETSGLPDDPEFIRSFNADLRQAQRGIDNLINPSTSKLRRAYQDVVDKCQARAWKTVDRKLEYAAYYKQRYNADRILHTEAARAYGQGARLQAIRDPSITAIKFSLASDHDCICICDVICNADLYGYSPGVYPKDQGLDYPFHPHCCLPDSRVWFEGRLVAATKSRYRGVIVEIITASKKRLTVTANHPILTRRGWVEAQFITKTDQVISSKVGKGNSFCIDPNDNQRPSRIKDIFRAVKESSCMTTTTMPVTAEDFHGDGRFIDGYVDIVRTDGLLLRDIKAMLQKHFCQKIFNKSLAALCSLFAFGFIAKLAERAFSSPNGIMGRLDSFRRCVFNVSSGNGLFDSTGLNSGFYKFASDHISANPQAISDFIFRHAAEIYFDQIVNIKFNSYSGHVYDLQVEPEQIYINNGVIVHNCHCIMSSIYINQLASASGDDFDPDRGKAYLRSLDADKRAAIMGKGNAAKFADDPDGWRDYLPGWNDPSDQTPDVPAGTVFGK
jgi:hypothetical protein